MTHAPREQRRALSPIAGRRASATASTGHRMARFAAGIRLDRLLIIGGLIAAGWLLSAIFQILGSPGAEAADPSTSGRSQSLTAVEDGSVIAGSARPLRGRADVFPTAIDDVATPAFADAAAMAGRRIDGLTSQSGPVRPAPSTADHTPGDRGLVPQSSGGSVLFGDVARPFFDPRLTRLPARLAAALPPVVRTAADDPSFSPD